MSDTVFGAFVGLVLFPVVYWFFRGVLSVFRRWRNWRAAAKALKSLHREMEIESVVASYMNKAYFKNQGGKSILYWAIRDQIVSEFVHRQDFEKTQIIKKKDVRR